MLANIKTNNQKAKKKIKIKKNESTYIGKSANKTKRKQTKMQTHAQLAQTQTYTLYV